METEGVKLRNGSSIIKETFSNSNKTLLNIAYVYFHGVWLLNLYK